MIDPEDKYWIECQQCSRRIKKLDHNQYEDLLCNPYNYVAYCYQCKLEGVPSDF